MASFVGRQNFATGPFIEGTSRANCSTPNRRLRRCLLGGPPDRQQRFPDQSVESTDAAERILPDPPAVSPPCGGLAVKVKHPMKE